MGSPPPSETDVLADVVETVVRAVLAPVVTRLRALETTEGPAGLLARVATLEGREAVPGPTGPEGPAGPPGAPGVDGVGLTYCGVWFAARTYQRGEFVTHDGSLWHANAATTAKPGDGTADWTLAVKRGRDAR